MLFHLINFGEVAVTKVYQALSKLLREGRKAGPDLGGTCSNSSTMELGSSSAAIPRITVFH